ncbi:TPA: hypothetical protein DEP90_02650 [Patescibacteria group bacterium]|nr:hypothetical protein [Patescibacteria group bacterium]
MKEYIKNLLLFFLIFFFTTTIFSGIIMPNLSIYYLSTLIILSTGVMMTKPFLNFLTIKINFLTYFLMSSILLIGIFFLLEIFMTGFLVEIITFEGVSLDFLQINGFEMVPVVTILLISTLSSLLCSIFFTLGKST